MGQWIRLRASDGHTLDAWRSVSGGMSAVVVLQEIFGVNEHIRAVADGFAAEGHLTLAPALFDRVQREVSLDYDVEGRDAGRALVGKLTSEGPMLDIASAVAAAKEAGAEQVAVVGYCWGGTTAWRAAAEVDGLAAAVVYYGGGVLERSDLEPRCPVLMHFGALDPSIPVDRVRAFADQAPAGVRVHVYEQADHGFDCDRRASYHAPSAELARHRTVAFLAEHLV
jgi:carboxymethylenebutenolidase